MAPEDMEKMTFVTMWGTFCYKVMPFGLKNAGATYQRAMVTLFHDMMHKEIEVYVDDMIAKSHTEKDHIVNLKKLFKILRKFQLKLNPAKCTFGVTSGKLLGFIVSERGIEWTRIRYKLFKSCHLLKRKKEVRGFLGRLNYIARFISQLTCKCDPIFKLLRKRDPGEWNEECQIAFDKIKEYLINPPVLVSPTVGKPFILYLTVNKNSMGCVLGQHDGIGKKEQAIYYLRSVIADFLTDRANEDNESISFDFPDEDLMAVLHIEKEGPNELNPWKMYFDGASNVLGHGIRAVLISPNEKYYPATARLNFNCTNNIAEYEALVMGLQAAIEMKVSTIDVYGDSTLVICRMRGEWETRDSKLVSYKKLVTELSKQFKEISFNHLPREENQIADALATIAAMFKIKEAADVRLFDLEVCEVSAHCLNVEEEVDGKPRYHDIMQYIKHQAYLENVTNNDKRTLRRLVMGFFLSGEVLYKRSRDRVFFRCVDVTEANKIMKEVHEGTYGAHANGHMLARQIMRAGYY
ncbi:Reverse transcriptase domain - like 10 [Theobroma cacao]|nr:Reverse transcriptase domain - like 10 [Theobroma cacao]WRX28553.1 Reverse transcriptase domain - like 10 [Theobroma cacao]